MVSYQQILARDIIYGLYTQQRANQDSSKPKVTLSILVKISWPQNIIKYRSVGKGLAERRWDDSMGER